MLPIDRASWGAITLDQSGSGSDGNKGILHITDIGHTTHQTSEYGTRPRFRWVQEQSRSANVLGEHKNVSFPVGLLLKMSHFRHQEIYLTPRRRIRARVLGPLRLTDRVNLACELRLLNLLCSRVRQSWATMTPTSQLISNRPLAQSAGAVEYTDCTSAEGKTPPKECPGYDTKQSDGEVPTVLELWGMRSTPSLPSLPGPLCPGVVAPDRALSMG